MKNNNYAVMNQCYNKSDNIEDYPTPPWATKALCEYVLPNIVIPNITFDDIKHYEFSKSSLKNMIVWEPCCNRGYMVKSLQEYFKRVYYSDILDYTHNQRATGWDFAREVWATPKAPDNKRPDYYMDNDFPPYPVMNAIITNPPFKEAETFISRSLSYPMVKLAAFFVRLNFLEGKGRYERLFSKYPPTVIAPFAERVPLVKGRYDPKASTATAYCWLVWVKDNNQTQTIWIPPCRKIFEKNTDVDLIIR